MRVTVTKIVEESDDRVLLQGQSVSGESFTFPLVYGAWAQRTQSIVEQVRNGGRPVVELPFEELDDD